MQRIVESFSGLPPGVLTKSRNRSATTRSCSRRVIILQQNFRKCRPFLVIGVGISGNVDVGFILGVGARMAGS